MKRWNIILKRCTHCPYKSGNAKGFGSCEQGTLDEDQNIYDKCTLVIWRTKYISYKSPYAMPSQMWRMHGFHNHLRNIKENMFKDYCSRKKHRSNWSSAHNVHNLC